MTGCTTALCRCAGGGEFDGVFACPKAQSRLHESSQKLDLLRLSLEQRLKELPQDHPKRAAIKEELSLGASPSLGFQRNRLRSSSSSSSFLKPSSLTGKAIASICMKREMVGHPIF